MHHVKQGGLSCQTFPFLHSTEQLVTVENKLVQTSHRAFISVLIKAKMTDKNILQHSTIWMQKYTRFCEVLHDVLIMLFQLIS